MSARRRATGSQSQDRDTGNSSRGTYELGVTLQPEFADIMSCRDRTTEFLSAVKSLQSRQGKALTGYNQPNGIHHTRSQFTILAKQIGKDISKTFTKLEKLAILAKKKSLFDDKPLEIQELTYIIKQDIQNLNQQIADLQHMVKSKGSAKGRHVQTHSHTVVMSLQTKLAYMSKDFKNVLEVRTENMKHQKQRRDQFSQGPLADSLPSAAMAGHAGGSVLQRNGSQNFGGPQEQGGAVAIDMGGMDNHSYSSQMQLLEEQDEYIKTRATAMESIESTIVELGGIFQQLAHMVKEQEEQIQTIDANVQETELNVEAAHSEILKYFQSITSNRWLIIKIFFVLIIFFIIFVVFMA